MSFKLVYKPYSSHAILVEWPHKIDENILKDVLLFKRSLQKSEIKQILYINHSYNSLLIFYDFTINNIYDKILTLKELYLKKNTVVHTTPILYKIPVCYDAHFGIDLHKIKEEKKLQISEIIKLHSQPFYTVFFVGFLPGFLYLGGLDKRLKTSRLKTPRLRVEKGSVGIGENQTGIYPNVSPGGWNIIGNSPINFFDVSNEVPCFAKAGDKIKFVPVTFDEYQIINNAISNGTYTIESEEWYD